MNTDLDKSSNRTIFILIFVVATTLVLTVYLAAQLDRIEQEDQKDDPQEIAIEQKIFWEISKIKANDVNPQNYDITVKSSAGAIREYENLFSFGISPSGEYLVTNSEKGFRIIDLDEDSPKDVDFAFEEYAGDTGKAITWNQDSDTFAVGVINKSNSNDVSILIFSSEGKLVNKIDSNLIITSGNKIAIESVKFASNSDLILARTYKAEDTQEVNEDGESYELTELPVYLSIYSVKGDLIEEIMIRDFDTSGTQIYYDWEETLPGFIKYGIFEKGEKIDPNQTQKLTFVSI